MKIHMSDNFKVNGYTGSLDKIWLVTNGMFKYLISEKNDDDGTLKSWLEKYYPDSVHHTNLTLDNIYDTSYSHQNLVYVLDLVTINQLTNNIVYKIRRIKKLYHISSILHTDIMLNLIHVIFIFTWSDSIPKCLYDPAIYIKPIKYSGIKLNIIREDVLVGGTKSRAVIPYIQNLTLQDPTITGLIYLGATNGYAQVAFANALNLLKSDINLRIYTQPINLPDAKKIIKLASSLYHNLVYVSLNKPMREIWPIIDKWIDNNPSYKLIEFGLRDNLYENLLYESLSVHLSEYIDIIKTMWLVIGSGAIFSTLYRILPNTFFNIVQVGKVYDLEAYDKSRYKLHVSSYKLYKNIDIKIPYPTTSSYDGKIWEFRDQFKNGDWIWNVAGFHCKI